MGREEKFSSEELLLLFQENSKIKLVKAAETFNVTEAAIRKRLDKLIKNGAIKKFTIEINPKKLGYEIVAFIGLDTEPEKYVKTLDILKELNPIRSIWATSVDHDILTECWFLDNEEYNSFIKQLESIDGVSHVCPSEVQRKIK